MTHKQIRPVKIIIEGLEPSVIRYRFSNVGNRHNMYYRDFLNNVCCLATPPYDDLTLKDLRALKLGQEVIMLVPVENIKGSESVFFPDSGRITIQLKDEKELYNIPEDLFYP